MSKAKSGSSQGASIAPEGSIDFFKQSVQEIKKVHPPTWAETKRMTLVVIVAMFFFALFLGATDYFVGKLMRNILY